MSDLSLQLAALLSSIVGMGCFALLIDAHWRQLFGARPSGRSARSGLWVGGISLVALAFWLCVQADPISMAALVWPMLLTIAAGTVAAILTVHARIRGAGSRRTTITKR